jgi:hypothetical protein
MNWKKGMFRVWIVASFVWALVWLGWAYAISQNHLDLLLASCDPLGSSEKFHKCYSQALDNHTESFLSLIAPGQTWLILFAPPVVALVIGPLLMKIVAWAGIGFSSKLK